MFRTIAFACVALLLCGCAHHSATATDGKATGVRVIDGDTIVVRIGGREESTRILGIDTSKPQKTPLGVRDAEPPVRPPAAHEGQDHRA